MPDDDRRTGPPNLRTEFLAPPARRQRHRVAAERAAGSRYGGVDAERDAK